MAEPDTLKTLQAEETKQMRQFKQEKAAIDAEIQQVGYVDSESKNLLSEMDDFLKDLDSWKSKR